MDIYIISHKTRSADYLNPKAFVSGERAELVSWLSFELAGHHCSVVISLLRLERIK